MFMDKPRGYLSGLLEMEFMEFMYALEEVNLLAASLTGWVTLGKSFIVHLNYVSSIMGRVLFS